MTYCRFDGMKIRYTWINIVLAIITLPVITHSCKDNPPCIIQCDSILEAHPDAFQYLIFPVGSWWEYELLDSEKLDTLKLFHIYKGFTNNQCVDGNDVCKYSYSLFLRHSNIEYNGMSADNKNESRMEFFLNTYSEGKSWVVLHSSHAYNNSTMGHFLNFPFFQGQPYTNDRFMSDTAASLRIIDNEVKCIQISSPKNQNPHPHRIMNIYFSRGIGLVRYEYQNGDVWQLKSYYIND